MKAFLTIIGSMLIFSAATHADEKIQADIKLHALGPAPKVIDIKHDSSTLKKILNKDLSEIAKIKDLVRSQKRLNMGGATSGGGDDTGVEVQRVLDSVTQMIENDTELYQPKIKQAIIEKARAARIIITEEELPATTGQLSQYGAAFSVFDGRESVVLIQRQRWTAIDSPNIKDSLIHHELAVLAGLETTGDYRYTNQFAIHRAKFWERLLSQSFVCTFSLYQKSNTQSSAIGKLLGSAGVIVNSVEISSNFEVIYDFETQVDGRTNRAAIVRYIVSNNGYLRAQISEADVKRYKNSDWKIFSNISKTSPEKTYFSPYDYMDTGRGANLESWGGYFIQVACSKI